MRVLVACEFSGTVRDAFIALGHDAVSCDLLPSDKPGPHIQGDVLTVLDDGWDLMIAHPPCTYLSVSGMHWTTRGLRDPKLTEDALDFVRALMDAPICSIAVENPISVISTRIRKPDQIINPYEFGEDASKKTCLWLKGLPLLKPTMLIEPRPVTTPSGKQVERWGNQTDGGQNKLPPSADRWKIRSKTYQGIANAMAAQWGSNQVNKHTPGPWYAGTKSVTAPETENRLGLDVRIFGGNRDDNKANARLIAAAPDMYEALKGMIQLDIGHHQRGPGDVDICKEVMDAYEAIAKAEGVKK